MLQIEIWYVSSKPFNYLAPEIEVNQNIAYVAHDSGLILRFLETGACLVLQLEVWYVSSKPFNYLAPENVS